MALRLPHAHLGDKSSPSDVPRRAGHILAWLPKAGRIVLAGGYSRTWLAQEIWTYDVAANQWKLLAHVPLADEDWGRQKFSQNCPRVTSRQNQLGAVNEDDVLVCGTPALTWACKVDPAKVDEQGTLAMAGNLRQLHLQYDRSGHLGEGG